jgi:hypothetical protein
MVGHEMDTSPDKQDGTGKSQKWVKCSGFIVEISRHASANTNRNKKAACLRRPIKFYWLIVLVLTVAVTISAGISVAIPTSVTVVTVRITHAAVGIGVGIRGTTAIALTGTVPISRALTIVAIAVAQLSRVISACTLAVTTARPIARRNELDNRTIGITGGHFRERGEPAALGIKGFRFGRCSARMHVGIHRHTHAHSGGRFLGLTLRLHFSMAFKG